MRQAAAGKDFEFEDRVEFTGFAHLVRSWAVRW
jgi:hypothetical protein